jgi:hypothetical protein
MQPHIIDTEYLYNGIKSLIGKDSAYAVSKYFDVTRTTAGYWRDSEVVMDDSHGLVAAKALNLDPDLVLAGLAAERAAKGKDSDAAAVWRSIALRLSTAANIGFLAIIIAIIEKSPAI